MLCTYDSAYDCLQPKELYLQTVFKSTEINLGIKSEGFGKEVSIRDGNDLCWSHGEEPQL
jgi:hypothetical protein